MTRQRYARLLVILLFIALPACQMPPPGAAVEATAMLASPTPLRSPTSAVPPTLTVEPTQTRVPGPPPSVPRDSRWQALIAAGYVVVDQSSLSGEPTNSLRAYLLTDGTKDTIMANRNGMVNLAMAYVPGACVLAFYRWNGFEDSLVGVLGEDESPFWCDLVDWDQPKAGVFYYLGTEPDEQTRQVLHLDGHWSDMNQNGVPELVVVYGECTNDCQEEYDQVRLFEVSNRGVKDIAANVLGTFDLRHLLIAFNPPAFPADSVTPYLADQDVVRTMIYRWEDGQFVDRSRDYPSYYQGQLDKIMRELAKRYGKPLMPFMTVPFLTILDITNWSDLPQEKGLQLFLEATAEEHWPGTDPDTACWLQLARGYAQADFAAGKPFQIYLMTTGAIGGEAEKQWLANEVQTISELGYDTSRCPLGK